MKEKVDSQESERMWSFIPVFGKIRSNQGLDRISLRSESKCTSQWLLFCLVHNIEKLWKKNEADGVIN